MRLSLPIPEGRKKSFFYDQNGFALPLVLIIMTLIVTLSVSMLSAMTFSLEESQNYLKNQQTILACKNAQEICKAELSADSNYAGTNGWASQDDGSISCIKVQTVSETKKFISIKTIHGDYGRCYEGEAELDPTNGKIAKWSLRLKRWTGSK